MLPALGLQVGLVPMPILLTHSQTPSCQISCSKAAALLTELRAHIDRLPDMIELAGDECPLACFSGSFEGQSPRARMPDKELQKS